MENTENTYEEVPANSNTDLAAEKQIANSKPSSATNIELLMDVSMRVAVELGRTRMQLAQILELHHGSVIELDRLAGDPVDVYVNDCMVARGEVVVVDDKFGVRITEMVSSKSERAV